MTSRQSLKSFLAVAKSALTAPAASRSRPLTLVVGNESADLDSLCSAVVLAYLRSSIPKQPLHIPLSNLLRDDLKLRTELSPILKHAGLEYSDILTLSDVPDEVAGSSDWLLVDHNALTGPLKQYQDRVVGCVDHHVDEGVIPKTATPRIIEHCGSAVTLIVDAHRDAWDALRSTDTVEEDARLARMCIAPILIDTNNLKDTEKMSEKDPKIVAYLEQTINDGAFTTQTYHDEINTIKDDISSLSLRDILRKDYKEWTEGGIKLGISCAVQNLDYLLKEKADGKPQEFLAPVETWAKERNLDVASVMTVSSVGGFHRHLFVWGITDKGKAGLQELVNQSSDKLQLEPWGDGALDKKETRMAWVQKNTKASRKQVAPLLRDAIKAVKEKL